jgi:hypothetical protein
MESFSRINFFYEAGTAFLLPKTRNYASLPLIRGIGNTCGQTGYEANKFKRTLSSSLM